MAGKIIKLKNSVTNLAFSSFGLLISFFVLVISVSLFYYFSSSTLRLSHLEMRAKATILTTLSFLWGIQSHPFFRIVSQTTHTHFMWRNEIKERTLYDWSYKRDYLWPCMNCNLHNASTCMILSSALSLLRLNKSCNWLNLGLINWLAGRSLLSICRWGAVLALWNS